MCIICISICDMCVHLFDVHGYILARPFFYIKKVRSLYEAVMLFSSKCH